MERAFKGIWIPKEIWLSEELTLQEKVMLVEIESLDNDDGCFATNAYFADFFGISNSRVSQVINSLKSKEHITIEYERNGREIVKRILKVKPCEISKEELHREPNKKPRKVKEKVVKHKYGEFEHVLLSDDELKKIKELYSDWEIKIRNLDEYLESHKKKHYDNHYLVIRKWARSDEEKKQEQEEKKQSKLPSWFNNQDEIETSDKIINDDELEKMMKQLRGE